MSTGRAWWTTWRPGSYGPDVTSGRKILAAISTLAILVAVTARGVPIAAATTDSAAPVLAAVLNEPGGGQGLYGFAADGSGRVMLMSSKGAMASPLWSPDELKIALLADPKPVAEPDLVVLDVAKAKVRKIAKSLGGINAPQWSPDSTKLAFLRGYAGFVVGADGTHRHQVTPKEASPSDLAWAHDSKRLLFREGGLEGPVGEERFVRNMYAVPVDGKPKVTVVVRNASNAVASPDGSKLAFERCELDKTEAIVDCDLYVADADGSREHLVVGGPVVGGRSVDDREPVWAPDSLRFGFKRYVPGVGFQLGTVNADGSGLRMLPTGDITSYQWAPDGTRISYEHELDDPNKVINKPVETWIINVSAKGTPKQRIDGCRLAWSADSARIAFRSRCPDGLEVAGDVVVANSDGSHARTLGTGTAAIWRPHHLDHE